jgi:catalase-peroxidase
MKQIAIAFSFLCLNTIQAQTEAKNPSKCPVMHGSSESELKNMHFDHSDLGNPPAQNFNNIGSANSNKDWWPNQLDLSVLRQNSNLSNPMGYEFNYKKAFNSLD